jgi:hypothetical protein
VSHPEHVIRLDTGAFRAARTARAARSLAYWIVLAVVAAGVAVGIAVVVTAVGHDPNVLSTTARTPAIDLSDVPAPATTPVAIWNATSVDGAANRLKIRLTKLGYPAEASKSHGLPKAGLKGTWVFYTPGHAAAGKGVAANLKVNVALRMRPVDGITPAELAPAVVLVVVGRS